MGRKKNKGRRSNNRRKRRKFYTDNTNEIMDETMAYDSHKENHKKYVNGIQTKESDYLNRTIFITNVKNLHYPVNIQLLKTFLEQKYGPVENCVVDKSKRHPYPGAKVTFVSQDDSYKIYRKSLLEVRKQKKRRKQIESTSCGHKGFITVQPGLPDRAQIHTSSDESYITFNVLSISMGHFNQKDGALIYPDDLSNGNTMLEYLEEYEGFRQNEVTLDLQNRSICLSKETTAIMDPYMQQFADILGHYHKQEDCAIFRLKDLYGALDLYKVKNSEGLGLIFVTKYPPKLVRKITDQDMRERNERLTSIRGESNAPFDHCFAYKLNITDSVAKTLFSDKAFFQKLRDFGMIYSNGIFSKNTISTIHVENIDFDNEQERKLEGKICSIKHEKNGKSTVVS